MMVKEERVPRRRPRRLGIISLTRNRNKNKVMTVNHLATCKFVVSEFSSDLDVSGPCAHVHDLPPNIQTSTTTTGNDR